MTGPNRAMNAQHRDMKRRSRLGAILQRVIDGVTWIILSISAVMFLVMTALVCLQVFYRYVLGSPLTGSEEAARAFMIFVVMLGSAVAVGDRAHMAIEYFVGKAPLWLQRICNVIVLACILAIGALLLVKGLELADRTMMQTTPALRIPKGYITWAFPRSSPLS